MNGIVYALCFLQWLWVWVHLGKKPPSNANPRLYQLGLGVLYWFLPLACVLFYLASAG